MKLPGGMNIQGMMKQASRCRRACRRRSPPFAWRPHGGGMVTVQLDGHKNCLGEDRPEAAGDAEMLQDMVRRPSAKPRARSTKNPRRRLPHAGRDGPAAGLI